MAKLFEPPRYIALEGPIRVGKSTLANIIADRLNAQRVLEPEDNGTRLRCGRDRLDLFAAMLLGMGCRIVVHSPAEMRQVFREMAQRATSAAVDLPASTVSGATS